MIGLAVTIVLFPFLPWLLALIGADETSLPVALRMLWIAGTREI